MRNVVKINEGFRAGKAVAMMPKIINIINKRTKNDYMFSPMAGNWKDSRGTWSAYEAYSSSMEVLRFKFALGKSDVIKEVEYLENYSDTESKYIIDLEGMNIIQVIDYVVDVLTGDFFKYYDGKLADSKTRKDTPLSEAVKMTDSIGKWILDQNMSQALSRMSDDREFEEQLFVYNQYASANQFKSSTSINTFKYHIKFHLKKLGIRNDVPAVTVVAGGSATMIIDTAAQDIFNNEVIENEHLIKYQLMEITIDRIRDGDPNLVGAYIYGTGGVGKSFYAEQELKPLTNCVYKSGAIQGYTGLLEILFPNRHGMIIVLDDIVSPGLMKNGNVENIFKGALGSAQHVDVIRPGNSASESKINDKPSLNEEDFFDMDSLQDFNADSEDKYNFDFTSKLVFITNIPHVPEAFGDRVEPVNMILTKEQIIDVIKSKLEFLATDVETDDKYEFFEWLRTNIKFAKKISFREYDKGLRLYLAIKNNSNWENMMRVRLKAGIAPKY